MTRRKFEGAVYGFHGAMVDNPPCLGLLTNHSASFMNKLHYFAGILISMVALHACSTTHEQVIVSFAPLRVATDPATVDIDLTPLHRAIRNSELQAVTELLRQGAPVNVASTADGTTPLMLAAAMGQEEIVAALLNADAALNTADKMGGTALMYASSKGQAGIVNTLLQHGAAVNLKSPHDDLDSTALTLAAGNGHDTVLGLLLKAGADIDWRTERDGLSALMLAATLGHEHAVRVLLAAGANPDLNDRQGNTACELAATNGHHAVAKILDDIFLARGQGQRCRAATH